MQFDPSTHMLIGKVTSAYGIKGWVKLISFTEPMDNIMNYPNWLLKKGDDLTLMEVDKGKSHGKGMVAHFEGVDDRNVAEEMAKSEIYVERSLLPQLDVGEYYWHQLIGLTVQLVDGRVLGNVEYMLETGASNDVLAVVGANVEGAIDDQERLIPYLPDQVIKNIDLEAGVIQVDWDPEF